MKYFLKFAKMKFLTFPKRGEALTSGDSGSDTIRPLNKSINEVRRYFWIYQLSRQVFFAQEKIPNSQLVKAIRDT